MGCSDIEEIMEEKGAGSRKELTQMCKDLGIGENSIGRYSKQNPSRRQVVAGKDVVFYTEGFEKANEKIEGHYVSGVCISVQTVYPTICQRFCDKFSRCYRDGSDLREVMERKGITLELQPRLNSQSSSLGSILRQARIRANHTRSDSSAAPYSDQE